MVAQSTNLSRPSIEDLSEAIHFLGSRSLSETHMGSLDTSGKALDEFRMAPASFMQLSFFVRRKASESGLAIAPAHVIIMSFEQD